MTRNQETRLKKLEQVRGARARRYCFYYDEVAEAEAQGLPYALVPRVLSRREWIERYGKQPAGASNNYTTEAWVDTPIF